MRVALQRWQCRLCCLRPLSDPLSDTINLAGLEQKKSPTVPVRSGDRGTRLPTVHVLTRLFWS
eukprot:313854-Rhodomonas_salina.4